MLTSKYSHVFSLKGATAPGAGVGFGDVDLCTAGQFNQGAIVDRSPRYPALQYEVVIWDTAGTVTAATAVVQALQPDGTWQTVSGQSTSTGSTGGVITIPLSSAAEPKAFAMNLFGPFIDLRVNLVTTPGTANTITAVISKWG